MSEIRISDGVVRLRKNTFSDCSSLKKVYLGNQLQEIEENAFSGCYSLQHIYFDGTLEEWRELRGGELYTSQPDLFFGLTQNLVLHTSDGANSFNDILPNMKKIEMMPGTSIKLTQNSSDRNAGEWVWTIKDAAIAKTKGGTMTSLKEGKTLVLGVLEGDSSGRYYIELSVKRKSITNADVKVPSCVYNAKAQTPPVTVKVEGRKLEKGVDYIVSYKNNTQMGRAAVSIKGKGKYTDTVVRYFAVNPKPSWIAKLSVPASKQIRITWGKRPGISGYQIQLCLRKDFSGDKIVKTVSDPGKLTLAVKVSKKNTNYYIRVRTFKKLPYKTYYSAWCSVKSISA